MNFTMIGLTDEPRVVKAGVVNGSFFEVMGLRPVLGRLLNAQDDGPKAAGAAVTHRFWTTSLNSDPTVIGKTVRLGPRTATVVGVLEPSVPYPADTEIIANVVTSPHHLEATMVTSRAHRMTELFGRLAPGASLERRAPSTAVHAAIMREHPEAYMLGECQCPAERQEAPRSDRVARADDPARAARRCGGRVRHRLLERRQSDIGALGAPRRASSPYGPPRRRPGSAPAHAPGREPGALRRRRRAGSGAGAAARRDGQSLCCPLLCPRARGHCRSRMLWIATGLAMAAAVLRMRPASRRRTRLPASA